MSTANYLRETIDLVKQVETRFLELGSRLYKIQAQHLWKNEYSSYSEFLDAAGISRFFASRITAVHEAYVLNAGIAAPQLVKAGYSKLYDAIPLLSHEDAKEVVSKANLLSQGELRDDVRDRKHAKCKHEETIVICVACKKRIYEKA